MCLDGLVGAQRGKVSVNQAKVASRGTEGLNVDNHYQIRMRDTVASIVGSCFWAVQVAFSRQIQAESSHRALSARDLGFIRACSVKILLVFALLSVQNPFRSLCKHDLLNSFVPIWCWHKESSGRHSLTRGFSVNYPTPQQALMPGVLSSVSLMLPCSRLPPLPSKNMQ